MEIDEEKLKKKLGPKRYSILRKGGTEAPFTGKLLNNEERGMYLCPVCGNKLFSSSAKFDSETGWPSFDKTLPRGAKLKGVNILGIVGVEVVCSKCESHLGHVFADDKSGTGKRYCINSGALDFKKNDKKIK